MTEIYRRGAENAEKNKNSSGFLSALCVSAVKLSLFVPLFVAGAAAQSVAPPPTADQGRPNVFYGAVPLNGDTTPVMVFVHGLTSTASFWWVDNEMYNSAFGAGFRTAFISLSRDNSPNNETIETNAAILKEVLPVIKSRYAVRQLYVIAHSKGGVDIQSALLDSSIAAMVKAVFTIATPNRGTELADWAFGTGIDTARGLGLLTPAIDSLRTAPMASFRARLDPVLANSGIFFYTLAGSLHIDSPGPIVTGRLLSNLTGGEKNDGYVTVARTRLPSAYAMNLGELNENHFAIAKNHRTFTLIKDQIDGLETTAPVFRRVASGGLGDEANTWAWSMKWFKGKLYVGTGRSVSCIIFGTQALETDMPIYPGGLDCAPDMLDLRLRAEIWRYTPETKVWERVYQSPEDVALGPDDRGTARYTARDVGYRGMTVFTEADGTEALYVGAVTASTIFGHRPVFAAGGYPPPRILRSVDGVNWQAIPQAPGTFMGDIKNIITDNKVVGFRSLVSYKGKLFATASDFRGQGVLIASSNPAAGNNSWQRVSPPISESLPVIWALEVFNNFLYVTTGKLHTDHGYGVYKTDAEGAPPYRFTPVITQGGNQPNLDLRSDAGLSMIVFNGRLYVGTNRNCELVRINPDDTWDVVVGEPRETPQGWKYPISGFGMQYSNAWNRHFWEMGVSSTGMYLATWDASGMAIDYPIVSFRSSSQFGLDLLKTTDGVFWTAISKSGLGDGDNMGGRTFESTPFGMFFGVARRTGGLQVFQDDGAGLQTEPDAPPAPQRLAAAPERRVGRTVSLTWDRSPAAARYRVYRWKVQPIEDFFGQEGVAVTIPGLNITINIPKDVIAGKVDEICAAQPTWFCDIVDMLKTTASEPRVKGFPASLEQVAIVSTNSYQEPAPTNLQSVYFVRAESSSGKLSAPSNIVGAPSKAFETTTLRGTPVTFQLVSSPAMTCASSSTAVGAVGLKKTGGPDLLAAGAVVIITFPGPVLTAPSASMGTFTPGINGNTVTYALQQDLMITDGQMILFSGAQLSLNASAAGEATASITGNNYVLFSAPNSVRVSSFQHYSAAPGALTFNVVRGASSPAPQTFTLNPPGAWSAVSNQSWLSVSPAAGTGSGTLSVTVNTTALGAGRHSGNLSFEGGCLVVPITVDVTPATLSAGSAALEFVGVVGQNIAPLSLGINGNSQLPFSVAVTFAAGQQQWLSVTPSTGTTNGSVAISVNTAGLVAATYNATLTVSSASADNPPVSVPVRLTLTLPASVGLSASSLTFAAEQGGPSPAMQTINITNSGGGTLTWTARPVTASGGNWLSVSPASGTGPAAVTVTVDGSTLSPGTFTGTIEVADSASGNSRRTIAVTFTVTAARTRILLNQRALTFATTAGGEPAPAEQTIEIAAPVTGTLAWTATAATESGNWLSVVTPSGTAPGVVTVRASAAGLARGIYMGSVTIAATAASNAENSPQVVPVTLSVGVPMINASGIVNAASFARNAAVSPGSIVSMFGVNLAAGTTVASSVPLPTTLAGTQVLVNNVAAPLFFVTEHQINFQAPFEITGTTAEVVVVSDGLRGPVSVLNISAEAPGIFTLGATGDGGAAALNQDGSLNSPSNPVEVGSVVSLFLTGLGATALPARTNEPGATAEPFHRTSVTPVVLIGGIEAEVLFSGLAPGFVGAYQLNIRLPLGTAPGAATAVQVRAGRGVSNVTTLAVR